MLQEKKSNLELRFLYYSSESSSDSTTSSSAGFLTRLEGCSVFLRSSINTSLLILIGSKRRSSASPEYSGGSAIVAALVRRRSGALARLDLRCSNGDSSVRGKCRVLRRQGLPACPWLGGWHVVRPRPRQAVARDTARRPQVQSR